MPTKLDPAKKEQISSLFKGAMEDTKAVAAAYYRRDGVAFQAARAERKTKINAIKELKKQ